jgi:hypothetical protein
VFEQSEGEHVADGDVRVDQSGDDWIVTIEGLTGVKSSYASRHDAFEAANRAARMAGSRIVLNLGDAAPQEPDSVDDDVVVAGQ